MEINSNSPSVKRVPIKIYNKKDIPYLTPNNKLNIKKQLDVNYGYSKSLKKIFYSYPIAIYKKPNEFEQYKERLILSEKPQRKKSLLNKHYHHIIFKSHSKSTLFEQRNKNTPINNNNNHNKNNDNKKNNNNNNNNNKTNNLYKTHYNKTSNCNFKRDKEIQSFYKTFYNRENNEYNNCNIFQRIYLSQVEKRGFNYNKVKQASIQRSVLNNLNKNDNNDIGYYTNLMSNKELSCILGPNKRKYFPQMSKIYINGFKTSKNISANSNGKINNNEKNQGVINIKNNPDFKFHVFRDKKGQVRELDKPCERILKMTRERVRDLKIMQKINKIKDPEIIKMYKSLL